MRAKTKTIIVKCSIVIAGISSLFAGIGFPITAVCLGYSFEESEITWIYTWIIAIASCIVMMCLMYSFPLYSHSEPQKISLSFENYATLKSNVFNRLLKDGFIEKTYPTHSQLELSVFIKDKPSNAFCVSFIRIPELTNNILHIANEQITAILKSHYKVEQLTKTIDMISVFCVDRVTPTFRSILMNYSQQGIKNGRLVVGLSFGGKKLYVTHQVGWGAFKRSKIMKQYLMEIFEINLRNKPK